MLSESKDVSAIQDGAPPKKTKKRNPIIQMFTLIQWSLLKNPHFLLTALGSSYSFNALLNFYLLLPLHAELKGCSVDDKEATQNIAKLRKRPREHLTLARLTLCYVESSMTLQKLLASVAIVHREYYSITSPT